MDMGRLEEIKNLVKKDRSTVIGIGTSLGCIATILIILRLYTYFIIVHKGGRPVIPACISWTLGTLSTTIYIYATYHPLVFISLVLPKVAAATGAMSIGFAKIGITLFILELQGNTHKFRKWFLICTLGLNVRRNIITMYSTKASLIRNHTYILSYIAMVPFLFLQCNANLKLEQYHCKSKWRADFWFVWTGSWSAATDIILAIYPAFLIWRLQTRRRVKIIASSLMGVGIIGAACGIGKAVESGHLHGSSPMYTPERVMPLVIFNTTEMWLVQIASAAAPLWPLVKHLSAKRKPARVVTVKPLSRIVSRHDSMFSGVRETRTPVSGDQDGSQDTLLAPGAILMTHHLSVHHEQV